MYSVRVRVRVSVRVSVRVRVRVRVTVSVRVRFKLPVHSNYYSLLYAANPLSSIFHSFMSPPNLHSPVNRSWW